MHDTNRLYKFYDELRTIHMTYFSNLHFGQFICNFITYYNTTYYHDIFYLEEDKFIEEIQKYIMWTKEHK